GISAAIQGLAVDEARGFALRLAVTIQQFTGLVDLVGLGPMMRQDADHCPLYKVRSTSTWPEKTRGTSRPCALAPYGVFTEMMPGRSDRGSSPWSRRPRSPGRTSPAHLSLRRPPPGPGAGSSTRRRDRRVWPSTWARRSCGRALRTRP